MPRANTIKSSSKKTKTKFSFLSNKKLRLASFALIFGSVGAYLIFRTFAAVPAPPAGGYFTLKPVGSFASLPNDAQAASMVHRSSWEPRPENYTANHTVPPTTFKTAGYSGMVNHAAVFGRVTGNFTGTTDEIIQWTAAKWGLSDDMIRAEAVAESYWYQGKKDAAGKPISGQGYGDFGSCSGQGSPPPSGYGTTGPSSFGLLQLKWCALKDASAPGYDGWPWTETSTAYALDLWGAVMRGCYEGWDTWLGNGYAAGDMWGCVGRWYSGQWHTASAEGYITTVQNHHNSKPWRSWPDHGTPPSDSVAPSAPTALKATALNSSQINLTWTASTDNVGVTGYNIYRNNVMITTVATNAFSDTGLTANTSYTYYAVAKDASGNVSTTSNMASATTPSAAPPAGADTTAPSVTISSPVNNATVGRSANISATGSDNVRVTKMEVYIDGVLKSNKNSSSISYSWASSKISRGSHTITVKAFDAAGNIGTKSIVVYK